MKRIFGSLSYANVASTLALVAALTGVAWAATTAPENSVVSKSIKDEKVKARDIGTDAVTGEELATDAATVDEIALGAVDSGEIVDESVGTDEIAQNAIRDYNVQDLFYTATPFALENDWEANDVAAFARTNEGVVFFGGNLDGSDSTSSAPFVLPLGARPVDDAIFLAGCHGGETAVVSITATTGNELGDAERHFVHRSTRDGALKRP